MLARSSTSQLLLCAPLEKKKITSACVDVFASCLDIVIFVASRPFAETSKQTIARFRIRGSCASAGASWGTLKSAARPARQEVPRWHPSSFSPRNPFANSYYGNLAFNASASQAPTLHSTADDMVLKSVYG